LGSSFKSGVLGVEALGFSELAFYGAIFEAEGAPLCLQAERSGKNRKRAEIKRGTKLYIGDKIARAVPN
jgi:hypothetical protein